MRVLPSDIITIAKIIRNSLTGVISWGFSYAQTEVIPAKDISRTAKERRAGSLGYAEAMLLAYNRKMRYPLRWGKLYNKKGTEDMGPDVETDMEPDDSEDD